jgi:hypothetical protein
MLSVLANGILVNDPRERTAANGNKFASGRVACPLRGRRAHDRVVHHGVASPLMLDVPRS